MLVDPRQLDLAEAESRALFEARAAAARKPATTCSTARRYLVPARRRLGRHPHRQPDAAVGMNLTDWVPTGEQSRAFRKLQNEVQVSWYTHPVNAARERARPGPINSRLALGRRCVAPNAQMLVARAAGKLAPRPAGRRRRRAG
jgi:hypothetical protein